MPRKRSLVDVHEKSKSYDWDYPDPEPKYPSRFIIPKTGKDPFRMLVRDYVRMEEEKDARTYGFLDGALRMRVAERAEPRFMEALKLTLPDLTNAEFQAVSGVGMIARGIGNQELRQGYYAQMLDEVRHTQLEMSLRRYYVEHAPDPAGWDIAQKALYQHPGGHVSLALFQNFNTGDVIDAVINLNVVVETAYTNILLVATPETAVANGDHALATTFLSIQSDEARHMANGYGTLFAVLQDESNVPLINEALERHFWHSHRGLDALVGWQSEYGAVHRPWVYREQWQEWVADDFIGSYVDKLTDFGVQAPTRLAKVAQDVSWIHHSTALALAAIWPLNFWRSDVMGPDDLEWFDSHYPGWAEVYGPFWQGHAAMADPSVGRLMLQELPSLPPFCQVCQLPCIMPRPDRSEIRVFEHGGRTIAVCSEGCDWIFHRWPHAYEGRKSFWAKYHGWDLADVILDLGYVRPDGVTLMGQPSVSLERLWTIDDIRRIGFEVKDPLAG